jgi:phosphatidylglycerol---prolipoprotein diacylglyceryl transferase
MLRELVHIGNFKIPSWGVLVMIGFLLGLWRATKNVERYGFKKEDLWDCCMVGLFGGVLGGRLAYIATQWSYFKTHLIEILQVWTGGMTSFGGLIGGVLAGVLAARYKKYNILDALDLTGVALPIGYGIGRIGCLLNGCCYGSVCDKPWALRFPDEAHPGELTPPSHPAQLYEAIATGFAYLIMVWFEKRRAFRGQLICIYGMLFSIIRFVIEGFRAGATAGEVGKVTDGQIACLIIHALSLIAYVWLHAHHQKTLKSEPRP